jgi:hypothetical protein
MGLNNDQNATFLSIANGRISRRVKEPTDKSVKRINKNNVEVHEEFFTSITGYITDIKVHDHPEYGKFWNITVKDGDDTFILQLNYSGGYASSFLKALPNVDFSMQVKLNPWSAVRDGKTKTALYINQGGQSVEWYFTKDTPNGLPPLTKKKVKGKDTWDDSEMMEFLESYVNENIKPKLTGVAPAAVAAGSDETDEEETDGALPF